MVSAVLTKTDDDNKPKSRDEFIAGLITAILAGNWDKVRAISTAGIAEATKPFNDGTEDYDNAVSDASDTLAENSAYYADKHKDLVGDTLKKYIGLVAAAELQIAAANVSKSMATGRIERITHPEMSASGVCPKCKELEGTHEPDDDELYWSHPNCCCEWRPEVVRLSSHYLTDNVEKVDNQDGDLKPMEDSMDTVKFTDYSKEERESFVKKGWALPDEESGGAFPIANKADLSNALRRIGTTSHPRGQVVAFIRKRAKELGAEDMLGEKTSPASHGVTQQLKDTAVFSNRREVKDGMVIRRGKVFEAGSRLDMHGIPFITTPEDLNKMVLTFKPFPVGSGHPEAPSPLDGHLGKVTNLYLGEKPTDLCAEVRIPSFVNDILERKNEGKVSMVFNRHTKEPLGLDFVSEPNVVDAALMASFARTRHDTPDGQKFMQSVHDACSKRGAVCKRGKSSHASSHEVGAIQQFHDIAAQHGAKCDEAGFANNAKGPTMKRTKGINWKAAFTGLFQAAEEVDSAAFAGDDPGNDFEANWQEAGYGGMGPDEAEEQPDDYEANWAEDEDGDADGDYDGSDVDEDEEQGADFHPAPLTDANPSDNPVAGTGGEWSTNIMATNKTVNPNDAKFATVMARNVQLEAELARERAHRIESEAVAFADSEISSHRSLPAERESLIELYRQASADDSALGEIKLGDGLVTSRCERLKLMFGKRDQHWMTKELLATTLSPETIAMAVETAHRYDETGIRKPMDAEQKAKYMNSTPLGKATQAALDAAKK